MGLALGRLAKEDPSFRVWTDEESNQTIIAGMGELHLDIIVDRMKREFNVEANVGKPQVAYRETIRQKVTMLKVNTRNSLVVVVSMVMLLSTCTRWSRVQTRKATSSSTTLKVV